ncbi:NADH-quinone oxidoreductase subunit NuoG [Aestuariivirga sp.]|uniref:NADH-quinone oxidoreductase subunit NuoG n=1 Tax=Aestuariivirga sp. TaxID=2650926 RepID=UPI0035B1DD9F
MKVKIEIDGREVEVESGRDLLTTCLEQGVDVPHFCWHGALGSAGACRLCAVKLFDGPEDRVGRIEMACTTPVKAGQRVVVGDPAAGHFRAHVIEWLMLNHPHDCAVCEEGGACHLQDMTVATGHHVRHFAGSKRIYRNQYLGPLLTHEMNRCIACYRCVRFYRDYAGGRDLEVFGTHDRVYFGRVADGDLESPFAGNLAEICPTGVFNDRYWSQHYARRWDMTATPAICSHCAVGCNIMLFERHGTLRQVQNRYHGAINGFFLCDRGRFGPLFADGDRRIVAPRHHGMAISGEVALDIARAAVAEGAIGIGSPRASLEANFALARLVGPERFFAGVGDAEAVLVRRMAAILRAGPARIVPLKEMETADAALVLGEDLTGTAPRAALALRQASRMAERALARQKQVPDWLDPAVRVAGEGRKSPITLVTPAADALDDVASLRVRRSPAEVAVFGHAVAAVLRGGTTDDEEVALAAQALAVAEAPLIIAGVGLGLAGPVEAAAEVAAALGRRARLALFPPEVNSLGLALLGGDGLETAAAALEAEPRPVIILENDLLERGDACTVERVMAAATSVVVLDCLETGTTARATLVLPVASPDEATGTVVNHEGRAQRSFAARPAQAPPAWRLLSNLGGKLFGGGDEVLDDVLAALAIACPALAGARGAAPRADERHPLGPVARAPEAFSGRTASDHAGRDSSGTPPLPDPDSGLGWSMEGVRGDRVHPAMGTGPSVAGLHSVSAAYHAQENIGGALKGGDPGIALLATRTEGELETPIADPPIASSAGLEFLPLHDPFAATETDRASPVLAARAGRPRIVLHPADAQAQGLTEGALIVVDGCVFPAPLSLDPRQCRGCAGLSLGSAAPRGRPRTVALRRP